MTKTRRLICSLNTQAPGQYTEKGFLKWLNELDLKQHCKYWDQYKKMDPNWKKKPCPSDPKDIEGWMKHYSAKYTTPAQCTRRMQQLTVARNRADTSTQKIVSCHKKHCGKLTEQLDTLFEAKKKPCTSLKVYGLTSAQFLKSPQIKCIDKVRKLPEIRRLARQKEACQTRKCKKEHQQSKLCGKRYVNAAEQKSMPL